jgi:hypothetical protein
MLFLPQASNSRLRPVLVSIGIDLCEPAYRFLTAHKRLPDDILMAFSQKFAHFMRSLTG